MESTSTYFYAIDLTLDTSIDFAFSPHSTKVKKYATVVQILMHFIDNIIVNTAGCQGCGMVFTDTELLITKQIEFCIQ